MEIDLAERKKRRREYLAILGLALLFVGLSVAEFRLTQTSRTLPFVNSIFFFGLLNINLIILIILSWLVFRNIGKVFIERRRKVLGTRLKTKLVIVFFSFSIIPTVTLFIVSAFYINSSFDKWFSLRVHDSLQASIDITKIYYRNTDQTAMHFAEHLATSVGQVKLQSKNLATFLEQQRALLALDAVEFYRHPLDERMLAKRVTSSVKEVLDYYPRLSLDLLDQAFRGERVSQVQSVGTGDLIRCLAPVWTGAPGHRVVSGVVAVNAYIPVSLANKVVEIANVVDDYRETNPLKYPMKTMYLVILVLITLVIIFVAIWIGLFLARELTEPIERLVYGAQAVGAGNLDVSIAPTGHDEIAVLVNSFNQMTHDLRDNRARLVQATSDLEKRRLQLEAILANVGTGVLAVDHRGLVTIFNRSASNLTNLDPTGVIGHDFALALGPDCTPLTLLIRAAFQQSGPDHHALQPEVGQWTLRVESEQRVLSAIVTPLRDSQSNWGVVAVIDDLTHLIKGQREMAWREVARRIAHEIKNPLTPIKLSAQRLQRRLGGLRGKDGILLQECAQTIIRNTDELKQMVDEFSNFARFPEVAPELNDLNRVLGEVITLYEQAHPQIVLLRHFESRLPHFEFDRDQIKRVIINLLDNAVAALRPLFGLTQGRVPTIVISTHFNDLLQIAAIEVSDNGPGIPEEVRARVFEPYFSTKAEGTGLGLAIAKRIVNDHDGFIRVQSNEGGGTQFLIELPTAMRLKPERKDYVSIHPSH